MSSSLCLCFCAVICSVRTLARPSLVTYQNGWETSFFHVLFHLFWICIDSASIPPPPSIYPVTDTSASLSLFPFTRWQSAILYCFIHLLFLHSLLFYSLTVSTLSNGFAYSRTRLFPSIQSTLFLFSLSLGLYSFSLSLLTTKQHVFLAILRQQRESSVFWSLRHLYE